MPTQYDAIGGKYQDIKRSPLARLEEHNLHRAIQPHIAGAKVLDLACGTGHYSRRLLEWGAASVMGVDISSAMVSFAEDHLLPNERDRISYVVADCAIPTAYPDGPFDIVLGSWFLNYASDASQLAEMYGNISMNLRSGGYFFGICPYPTNEVGSHVRQQEKKPGGKFSFDASLGYHLPDGVCVHLKLYSDPLSPPVEFDFYHLRQEVWDRCAWEGDMKGSLDWIDLDIPVMTDLGESYWDGYADAPSFNILVIRK